MCDYFETYGIFSYGKDLNMSVFQLLNSPVSGVDGATKLFDIQAHPIRTKQTIHNARKIYSSKKIPRETLLTDVYQLRVGKDDMIISHNTYRDLISKRDKITIESGRSEYRVSGEMITVFQC